MMVKPFVSNFFIYNKMNDANKGNIVDIINHLSNKLKSHSMLHKTA